MSEAVKKSAKKPADHKPKQKDVTEPESLTVTVNERVWTVDPAIMDDFELLEDLAEIDRRNATRFPSLLKKMLGDDQYRDALNSLRGDDGRVSIDAGSSFVMDLFQELNPNS